MAAYLATGSRMLKAERRVLFQVLREARSSDLIYPSAMGRRTERSEVSPPASEWGNIHTNVNRAAFGIGCAKMT